MSTHQLSPAINMQQFCMPIDEPFRHAIYKPWVHQFWMYATDSRICVRVPCNEPNWEPPANPGWREVNGMNVPKKPPRAQELGWVHSDNYIIAESQWHPWPELDLQTGRDTCPGCRGKRFVDICQHCKRGDECDKCEGEGYITRACLQMVCGVPIRDRYDAMIRELQDVRCAAAPKSVGETEPTSVLFTFGYPGPNGEALRGEGIVMGVVRKESQ